MVSQFRLFDISEQEIAEYETKILGLNYQAPAGSKPATHLTGSEHKDKSSSSTKLPLDKKDLDLKSSETPPKLRTLRKFNKK